MLEIVIDDRESKEFIDFIKYYADEEKQFSEFNVIVERLPFCDIICRTPTLIGTVGIEIKRGTDFMRSVIDGRHPNQVINAMNNGIDNYIFILIGDTDSVLDRNRISSPAYYGAIASAQTKYRCSINFVPDDHDAALLSLYIFKHSNLIPRTEVVVSKANKQQRQVAMVSCIEGIGRNIAEIVLQHYSFNELVSITDPKLLTRLDRIGIKTAQKIVDFFHS